MGITHYSIETIMDFEIPRWLTDDRARRRRQRRKERTRAVLRSVRRIFTALCWIGVLTGFIWFLFYLYGAIGELAQPISYVSPQIAEAAEVSVREHEVVLATVTAYTSSVDETDDTPFISPRRVQVQGTA